MEHQVLSRVNKSKKGLNSQSFSSAAPYIRLRGGNRIHIISNQKYENL